MKYILFFLLFFFVSCITSEKTSKQQTAFIDPIYQKEVKTFTKDFSFIPKNPFIYAHVSSLSQVQEHLKTLQMLYGKNISILDMLQLNSDFQEMAHMLQSLSYLESIGIDTQERAGIAFYANPQEYKNQNSDILLYIPIHSKQKLSTFLYRTFLERAKEDDRLNYQYKEDTHLAQYEDIAFQFSFKKNYLLFSLSTTKARKLLSTIKTLKPQNSFIHQKEAQQVLKQVSPLKDAFFYMDINQLKQLEASFELELEAHNYHALYLNLDLSQKDCSLSGAITLKNQEIAPQTVPRTMSRTMPSPLMHFAHPLVFGSVTQNFKQRLNVLNQLFAKKEKQEIPQKYKTMKPLLDAFLANTSLAFKERVLNNTDGELSYLIYDAKNFRLGHYNLLMHLHFFDIKKVEAFMDALVASKMLNNYHFSKKNTMDIKGIDSNQPLYHFYTKLTPIYLSFYKNSLILTTNKKNILDLYQIQSIKTKSTLPLADKKRIVFYLSFLELEKAMENFRLLMPENMHSLMSPFFKSLKDFTIKQHQEGHMMFYHLKLQTNFKQPFLIGFINLIKELQTASKENK